MNNLFKLTGPIFGLVLTACAFTANAQKIEETELKKNVTEISNPLSQLGNLKPIVFEYDKSKYNYLRLPTSKQYGFLAENMLTQFPDLVKETGIMYNAGKNHTKTAKFDEVRNEALIPVLVAAINEQQSQIEALRAEIKQLRMASK